MLVFSRCSLISACLPLTILPQQMNIEKVQRHGKEVENENGCGGGVEGEGAASGPYEAGCDFNTWSSQSHYRLQSEEHRGQT